MQHSTNMSNSGSSHAAQACCSTRHSGVCDRMIVGLVLLTLVRTTEVLAGEQGPLAGSAAKADFNALRQPTPLSASMLVLPIPAPYQAVDPPDAKTFSTQEFRPRGHSLLEKDSRFAAVDDAPTLRGTTVWQRLSEYRSRDRVRLVTLWETDGSSISLQAGRKGNPSLQWTSRFMNRGGATRGLLDGLLTNSLGGVGRGLLFAAHKTNTDTAGKPAKLVDAGVGGAGGTK
jgi:hypothetical protein